MKNFAMIAAVTRPPTLAEKKTFPLRNIFVLVDVTKRIIQKCPARKMKISIQYRVMLNRQ
jgi:hypothetical protein